MTYKFHPIADAFRLLEDDELQRLADDIRDHGLRQDIELYDGQILDGRNRYRACLLAQVTPRFRTLTKSEIGDSVVAYVQSVNEHRRHDSTSQRGMAAARLREHFEAEAKERQKRKPQSVVENLPQQNAGKARDKAGEAVGVSGKTVDHATKVLTHGTKSLQAAVDSGKVKVSKAAQVASLPPEVQDGFVHGVPIPSQPTPPMPKGRFNLILCDPPWRYEATETYSRAVENQYATMQLDDICELEPPAGHDCVLFMWATAPLTQEALRVIDAWGFNYRTHAVWDKTKIGMGYWFRGQHELLMVATRGDASPPSPSYRVSSIFVESRGKHSVKPTCVYEWIESAFPDHTKCEMFARSRREGWESWGNEA